MKGAAEQPAYVTSKWAVRGLTKAASVDLAADGIRVNSVHPGVIDTPMIRRPGSSHDAILERHRPAAARAAARHGRGRGAARALPRERRGRLRDRRRVRRRRRLDGALMAFDYAERRARLAEAIEREGIDLLFVPRGTDLEYLAGLERDAPTYGAHGYTHDWVAGAFFRPGHEPRLLPAAARRARAREDRAPRRDRRLRRARRRRARSSRMSRLASDAPAHGRRRVPRLGRVAAAAAGRVPGRALRRRRRHSSAGCACASRRTSLPR